MGDFNKDLDPDKKVDIGSIAEKLIQAADRIYDHRIRMALGQPPIDGFEKGVEDRQDEIINAVRHMLEGYQQARNLTAQSSSEVLKLVSKGKITPKEAAVFLEVLNKKVEVEEKERKLASKKALEEYEEELGNKENG